MDTGSFRFEMGEFECVSLSDGALNYPPESFSANVPSERVEEALRQHDLPTAQIMTPYTCDTRGQRSSPPRTPRLLDPFCGPGTTGVAAKELGLEKQRLQAT